MLDNGAFHNTKSLEIPENIVLIFLPPYSPELNPAEKIWAKFKRTFANIFFETIEDLQTFACSISNSLTKEEVNFINKFSYTICYFWSVYYFTLVLQRAKSHLLAQVLVKNV